jgi:stage II sporulation protein M
MEYTHRSIWEYYKSLYSETKPWIKLSIGSFFVAFVVGVASYSYFPDLMDQILKEFKKIAGENPKLNANLVFVIFRQNLQSSLMAIFGGVALGLVPFLGVWINGFVLGYVARYFMETMPGAFGQKIFYLALLLLPHGIFELPIVLISAAIGMRMGLNYLKHREDVSRGAVFKADFMDALKFIPLLVVVLAVAALIEVFVSIQIGIALRSK